MTDEQCLRCRFASGIGGFPDGQDMFTCDKLADSKMPFTMESDTPCPCFEEVKEWAKYKLVFSCVIGADNSHAIELVAQVLADYVNMFNTSEIKATIEKVA